MGSNNIGEIAALLTAVCWTGTSMAFEQAGKRIGSMGVNILRLGMAFLLYAIALAFTGGHPFPTDASMHQWIWLGLSAIVGFVIGDYLLLNAYITVGARISMLIMSLSPPLAALIGWMILGEKMTLLKIGGMFITMLGVAIVILKKNVPTESETETKSNKYKLSFPKIGLLFAFGGAAGQAVGLVLSKYGMESYNAFSASQIRVFVGFWGFMLLNLFMKNKAVIRRAFTDKIALRSLLIGTVFGPFFGVSLSLLAVQNTETGVASTLMSIVPILIIPLSIIINKEKISLKEVIGAVVAVMGVSILFI
jgi:drug/metabolite transporter (DMT)-like permease